MQERKIIIVTAGGTIEPIDGVRGITNFSRGRLGLQIAERLGLHHTVIYVRSRTAPAPAWTSSLGGLAVGLGRETPGIIDLPITDTASVWDTLQRIRALTDVHAIIHAMAISDYTVERVVDLDEVVAQVMALAENGNMTPEAVAELLRNPPALPSAGKVSSALAHPILYLEQTQKILPQLKGLWPNAKLVGFKLLNGVPEAELLSVARAAMEKVDGDFVVANDLTRIHGEQHQAFILRRGSCVVSEESTKTGIVDRLEEVLEL